MRTMYTAYKVVPVSSKNWNDMSQVEKEIGFSGRFAAQFVKCDCPQTVEFRVISCSDYVQIGQFEQSLPTKISCLSCNKIETFTDILGPERLRKICSRLQWLGSHDIWLEKLEPVARMVTRTTGKTTYTTMEDLTGPELLRHYYPGAKFVLNSQTEALDPTGAFARAQGY